MIPPLSGSQSIVRCPLFRRQPDLGQRRSQCPSTLLTRRRQETPICPQKSSTSAKTMRQIQSTPYSKPSAIVYTLGRLLRASGLSKLISLGSCTQAGAASAKHFVV